MFEFWLYVCSFVICLVCGCGFFGDGLYFAISKIYESRFTALIDREVTSLPSPQIHLVPIPKLNIHAMQLGDSLDNR